jgi:hypothetical protein
VASLSKSNLVTASRFRLTTSPTSPGVPVYLRVKASHAPGSESDAGTRLAGRRSVEPVRLLATGGAGFIRSNDVRWALGHTADRPRWAGVAFIVIGILLIAQGSPSA